MKRALVILGVIALLLFIASATSYDGVVRPIDPQLEVRILDSTSWYTFPNISASLTDPYAVYVMAPEMPEGDLFAAIRVDVKDGGQTRTKIAIGPETEFRPCQPVKGLRAEVRGVRFKRPSFFLWTFPDGKGPGIRYLDSATGHIDVVVDEGSRVRRILTQPAYNSDRIVLLLALVHADPGGHWIAAVSQAPEGWARGGWKLFVFARSPDANKT